MRPELGLHAPDAHPAWCECSLLCAPRKAAAAARRHQDLEFFAAGALAFGLPVASILLQARWPVIAAWWWAL